jgi:hypothetical protein
MADMRTGPATISPRTKIRLKRTLSLAYTGLVFCFKHILFQEKNIHGKVLGITKLHYVPSPTYTHTFIQLITE